MANQYFANYNPEDGSILGFYTPDIHDSIPQPALAITEGQWQECLSSQGNFKVINGVLTNTYVAPTDAEILASAQTAKLTELSDACATAITAGFQSSAMGSLYQYDSTSEDQANLSAMYQATRLPNFATTPPYNGEIPLRACPVAKDGTVGAKVVLEHNTAEIQQMFMDMLLHTGTCKQNLWTKQGLVAAAKTVADVEAIAF